MAGLEMPMTMVDYLDRRGYAVLPRHRLPDRLMRHRVAPERHIAKREEEEAFAILDTLIRCAEIVTGVNRGMLRHPQRTKQLAEFRQLIMTVAMDDLGCSSTAIGCALAPHHSTVLSGVWKMRQILQDDAEGFRFRGYRDRILKQLFKQTEESGEGDQIHVGA